jgi:cellobiose phosphorylase
MNHSDHREFSLPLEDELGLHRLTNASGLEISVLPNGCVFAIEHVAGGERTMISQVFGSPLGSGIGRVLLRIGTDTPPVEIAGPGASTQIGIAADRFIWEGETDSIRHRVTLWLSPDAPLWLWRVSLENKGAAPRQCDAILIQDLGLAARGLVLANESYASQYIDHHIAAHPQCGPVIMSRQNMAQYGRNPWAAHGCVDGAARFATDALQLFGPAFRESGEGLAGFGGDLADVKLQHEAACAAIQSRPLTLAPGEKAALTFFGLFDTHHGDATGDADLARLDAAEAAAEAFAEQSVSLSAPARSILQTARPLSGRALSETKIAQGYPDRLHEERQDGALLSFFMPDGAQNRHVALAAKEGRMNRRHGAILRSGDSLLLDEHTLSATCWMHGVFGAQLTIGNTALHKLFSVSRDPYNITRASGLRILADRGEGWRLLTVPSVFEIGLNDCRWVYDFDDGAITIHAFTSTEDTAMAWTIETSGKPCRFLIFGHLVMGEHEFRHPASVEIGDAGKRLSIRPGKDWIWGGQYAQAVHHLVTATPDAVDAMGSGALLFEGDAPRSADAWIAVRTKPTERFAFALVGALDDPAHAETLAAKYARGVDTGAALEKARGFWSHVTRDTRFPDDPALDTIFPWLAHDAMIHLTVPRGLEQYSAAAWGTRDVCQGPIELLLPLGHHEPVAEILRIVFAQQYENAGDWPQWFMLAPYGQIRDRHSHGDVIVWPLKALCDYLEATGDLAFLSQEVAWTADDFTKTARKDSIAVHVDKLLDVVRGQFIPGTHLIRYGLGDWNDSLQPADPEMRDWMVSSWTVALLYQQIIRYEAILKHAHDSAQAASLLELAARMREDFNRHLMPDGTVAGYTLFHQDQEPEYLLHPRDHRTGVSYSLIPMTRSIIAGLFTPEQAEHHLDLIRTHLLCPDGARLMDKPVKYSGGLEINFRRAESASFFGREIGLMYTHSHLRYCEALGILGERQAAREALRAINPIAVTEDLATASLRQRNAYFSSSDAAFRDRDEASAEWARVRDGKVAVDGGWRIYSSGPGIFMRLALRFADHVSKETPQA